MRDGRAEALRLAISEGMRNEASLRKAYADLRETCAFAIDPRTADRDLARLLVRYLDADDATTPIGSRFEAVRSRLPSLERGLQSAPGSRNPVRPNLPSSDEHPRPAPSKREENFIRIGIEALLSEHLDLALAEVRALDPWAGDGDLAASLNAKEVYANEADPLHYARMARSVAKGAVLADSFRLPERRPTPAFSFGDDENTIRVDEEQARSFEVIASDLRNERGLEAKVRWMSERLAPKGIVAFLSEGTFVDEPNFAKMRENLVREFGLVAHVALPEGLGVTFLLRGGGGGRVLYAEVEKVPGTFERIEWRELHPAGNQVWRTEILREEWPGFAPLVVERGAIFAESSTGSCDGKDSVAPSPKAHRVLRHPFAPVWRTLDRRARREASMPGGPRIVAVGEPFGVLAVNGPFDRRLGGSGTTVIAAGGRVAADAMRRFRTAYGAAVTERDVFDATLALLHHPEYRLRYYEDLRRDVPRLPVLGGEALTSLAHESGAPLVGPGTAFRTGWVEDDLFEPGTIPDYDDPFASPYARADVDPGFLLLVGLGEALYRVQVDFERLRAYPLNAVGKPSRVERPRLAADRTRLILSSTQSLDGIPLEAYEHRFGRRSAPEWVVEALRTRSEFDPNHPDDPDRPARLFSQAVTASLETRRLAEIVGRITL